MSIQEDFHHNRSRNGKAFAGLILLAVGCIYLLRNLTFFYFPNWIFTPSMFLLVLGLYFGVRHNFRSPVWVILAILGGMGVLDDIIPFAHVNRATWPLIIICIGVWLVTGRNKNLGRWENKWHNKFSKVNPSNPFENTTTDNVKHDPMSDAYDPSATTANPNPTPNPNPNAGYYSAGDDVLEAISVFGSVKKTILSKNFKGGEIINVFGGTELDFTMADINGTVIIEVVQLFGGIKMIVPPHWQVVSDVAAVFAGVDDKRRGLVPQSTDKLLVLKGVSIFAGIDIRSY